MVVMGAREKNVYVNNSIQKKIMIYIILACQTRYNGCYLGWKIRFYSTNHSTLILNTFVVHLTSSIYKTMIFNLLVFWLRRPQIADIPATSGGDCSCFGKHFDRCVENLLMNITLLNNNISCGEYFVKIF